MCAAVSADDELELVAAADPHHAGIDLSEVVKVDVDGVRIAPSPEMFRDARVEVVVDFTHFDAARENLRWAAEQGVHAVVGTTGFDDADYEELRSLFTASNCFIAPNFAIGAVLMMRFSELAAPWFESAEIVEMHHDAKRDAPSGTAMSMMIRLAQASAEWTGDPTDQEVVAGARGGEGPHGIRVHSLRLRGPVAHHEVLLGTTGQTLSIRHDSYDRSSFMPGVLLAVKAVADRPGLTVGLDSLLFPEGAAGAEPDLPPSQG
ncbi:4-hydroxy-tetrahydrodipicolinate reductase [soil metagenome]